VTDLFFNPGLSALAPNYDALLCDAWGVIHNGVELFPGVEEALVRFCAERGPVFILTNAPRPSSIIPAQLDRLGLSRDAYDGVVTSGDAVRYEIKRRLPGAVYRLGPSKDDPLFADLNIDFVNLEDADFIICTGPVDDQCETPEDYRGLLTKAAELDLDMICANPDIVVRWGERLIYCAGALAQVYEELGGQVYYGGKPHKAIYDLAAERLEACKSGIARERVLAIGDGIGTDIYGANQNNIDAVYVFGGGGIHAGDHDRNAIEKILSDAGVQVCAAMERLGWR